MSDSQETALEELATNLSNRKHYRLECDIEVLLLSEDGSQETARLRNVGLGGARVDAIKVHEIPAQFDLLLPARPDRNEIGEIQIPCRISWTVTENAKAPYPTGLQFMDLNESQKESLFRYLANIMR